MTIFSPMLLFFVLPAALAIFHLAGRCWGASGGLGVIVVVGFVFAQSQGWPFFVLFVASTALNAAAVLSPEQRAGSRRLAKFVVFANLAALVLFKYANAFTAIPQLHDQLRRLGRLIPITISFMTFQRLAALVDARLRRCELAGARGALRYLAFIGFFPNLLIGPVPYLQEILPQMRRSDFGRVRAVNLAVGLSLLAIGIFKKAFLADPIGTWFVDPVWHTLSGGAHVGIANAGCALVGYVLQLYFDFSGYSDGAIGLARLFGVILPINFYSPLRAVGVVDFYRRWHVGLTRLIARFLYTPLALKGMRFARRRKWRGPKERVVALWLPLLANFLVIGVWHGATATFVLFGLIHGIWYVAETEISVHRHWKRLRERIPGWQRALVGRALTLPALMITFSLFRAPDLTAFCAFASSLCQWRNHRAWLVGLTPSSLALLCTAIFIVAVLPNTQELFSRYRPGLVTYAVPSYTTSRAALRWRPTAAWLVFILVVFALGLCALPMSVPFAYGVF